METASTLASRLSEASVKKTWDVYSAFDWPERLEGDYWYMPPEFISLYGTELWEGMDSAVLKRLSLCEIGNFFSLTLHGERPLMEGMCHRLYVRHTPDEVTRYLHHFVDEENKHMVMFGMFCHRYLGKVYPEKKLVLPRTYAPGEEDVVFFTKVLIVEELGDVYNVLIAKDERVHPLVREINRRHHDDEARHIIFGRRYLAELFHLHSPQWSAETLAGFRSYVREYLMSTWGDFYNPALYRDAGLPDAYGARQVALQHAAPRAHRAEVSQKLVNWFMETGILIEEPEF